MTLTQALDIRPGVTAVIGGGGKTSLLRALGGELAEGGHTVLLCTTTKIFPFPGLLHLASPSEEELRRALAARRLLCVGVPLAGTGKLTAPALPMEVLAELADYVLVEADGSAGRPMKAHAPHEPVIPALANQTVCVAGASGFGRPIGQAVHRPERFAELAGASLDAAVTPEGTAAVLLAEALHTRVYVNQTDTDLRREAAQELIRLLPCPAAAGALQDERSWVLCW